MPCDRFKLIYIFCKHWISMPVIMHFTLLFSPKRKSLIFILLASKCSALIYLFTAIYFHKMVPMVRLLIYCSVCFILPIITLVFATLAFKFSFWVLHSAQLSIEFHPTSSHLSQWISMGIEIPYFSIGKRGKKKAIQTAKNMSLLVFLNWKDSIQVLGQISTLLHFPVLLLQWPIVSMSL